MEREKILISERQLEQQRDWMRRVRERVTGGGARPLALVDTYGLQPVTNPQQDLDAILHRG